MHVEELDEILNRIIGELNNDYSDEWIKFIFEMGLAVMQDRLIYQDKYKNGEIRVHTPHD